MRIPSVIPWTVVLLAQQASCVRVDLDNSEEREEEVADQALRISATDSVVLCPLSAAVGASGKVSIVWAGYPPADDRLQLMHALVSPKGDLLQAPRSIALLESELAALEIQRSDTGFEVRAIEDSAGALLAIELDDNGLALDMSRQPAIASSRLDELCESSLLSTEARLSVFRSQVDGEFPLFVQSSAY